MAQDVVELVVADSHNSGSSGPTKPTLFLFSLSNQTYRLVLKATTIFVTISMSLEGSPRSLGEVLKILRQIDTIWAVKLFLPASIAMP